MGINTYAPIFIPSPKDKNPPSLPAIVITAMIPPIWPVTIYLIYRRVTHTRHWKQYANFKNYAAVIGTRPEIDLADIASVMGRPMSMVQYDIQSMINKGYLGSQAYIDRSVNRLYICRHEQNFRYTAAAPERPAARTVPKAQSVQETRKPQPAAPKPKTEAKKEEPESVGNEFEETLTRIRQLNDRIADEGISAQIDRIGMLTAGIFAVVQMKPEHKAEVNKFMNYYLPTTFKLLEMYALMEKQGYQSASIKESREKIRGMLDMLIQAFEKQQDLLFKSEATNIDVDIATMESMMARDGLVLPKGADIEEFMKRQQTGN